MHGKDGSIVQNPGMPEVNRTEQLKGNNATVTPPYAYNFSITHDQDGKLIVYYFSSSSGCKPCDDMAQMEKELKEKYGDRTVWREFDLQKPEQGAVYWSFASFRKLPICLEKVPAAFVDNTLLVGFAVNDSLEKAINQSLTSTD